MNSRNLIDQTIGRVDVAQVMRAAHRRARFLADNGHKDREAFAAALRNAWKLAQGEALVWKLAHSSGVGAMLYTGGKVADGVANEMVS